MTKHRVFRGQIYYLKDEVIAPGSEQGGTRPVLIIQNNRGNGVSTTTIVAPITAQTSKQDLPVHVKILACNTGLYKDSMVLLEQIRTIDTRVLGKFLGRLSEEDLRLVDNAILVSLGITK